MKRRLAKLNSILLIAAVMVTSIPHTVLADEVVLEEISAPAEEVLEPIKEEMVPIEEESNADDDLDYSEENSLINVDDSADEEIILEESDDSLSANSAIIYSDDVSAFPESYRQKINKLMTNHPNWKFVKVNTDLEWDEVVANEMKKGRSLIEKSADKEYVGDVSSGSWCYATIKGVEHYLDPRTYLDESHIFAHSLLAYDGDTQKLEYVSNMCSNNDSFMKGNLPKDDRKYSDVLFSLGKANKINPLYLVARIFQEQGYKGKDLTKGTDGYFNYYNIKGAFSSELEYAKSKGWDTAYKALK